MNANTYMMVRELQSVSRLIDYLNGASDLTVQLDAKVIDGNGDEVGAIRFDENGAGEYVWFPE